MQMILARRTMVLSATPRHSLCICQATVSPCTDLENIGPQPLQPKVREHDALLYMTQQAGALDGARHRSRRTRVHEKKKQKGTHTRMGMYGRAHADCSGTRPIRCTSVSPSVCATRDCWPPQQPRRRGTAATESVPARRIDQSLRPSIARILAWECHFAMKRLLWARRRPRLGPIDVLHRDGCAGIWGSARNGSMWGGGGRKSTELRSEGRPELPSEVVEQSTRNWGQKAVPPARTLAMRPSLRVPSPCCSCESEAHFGPQFWTLAAALGPLPGDPPDYSSCIISRS